MRRAREGADRVNDAEELKGYTNAEDQERCHRDGANDGVPEIVPTHGAMCPCPRKERLHLPPCSGSLEEDYPPGKYVDTKYVSSQLCLEARRHAVYVRGVTFPGVVNLARRPTHASCGWLPGRRAPIFARARSPKSMPYS